MCTSVEWAPDDCHGVATSRDLFVENTHLDIAGGLRGGADLRPEQGALAGPRQLQYAAAAGDAGLMRALRELGVVLEICPTSNLLTKALADEDAVRETIRQFVDNGVGFTIATDGPEMMRTHLRDEFELLLRIGALDEDELREANARGHAAAFNRATAVSV